MAEGRKYKDQKVVIEGSRSGALVFHTKMSYDANKNLEYIGESATGNNTNIPQWYIEKLEYDSSFNMIDVKVASNQLYSGVGTIDIDTITNAPHITLTITTADYSLVSVNDLIKLTTITNGSLIQGQVVSKTGNILIINVNGISGIVDESSTAIGDSDLLYTLNNPNYKDFDKRVWDFRSRYVYK